MWLHDNYIYLSVNFQLVDIFHYKAKCNSHIVWCLYIFVMAERDRKVPVDQNYGNQNSHCSSDITSTQGSVHEDPNQVFTNVGDASSLKKKPTSFQITSVTVQGSRLSTDGGEDSADDLDESHTDDLSSDILDCSRTTDVDTDLLSEEISNTNNSVMNIPVKNTHAPQCAVESSTVTIPTQSEPQAAVSSTMSLPSNSGNSPDSIGDPATKPPTITDQGQHRFKVVKIMSTQPYKRGRWLCLDFLDPPTVPASETKVETPDSVATTTVSLSGVNTSVSTMPSGIPSVNSVAHVYEITPNDTYPGSVSVTVSPQPTQQPFYGIFLPLNNPQFADISSMPAAFLQDPSQRGDSNTQVTHQSVVFTSQHIPLVQQNIAFQQRQQPNSFVGNGNATYDDKPIQQQAFISSTQVMTVPSMQMPVQQQQTISSAPVQQMQQAPTITAPDPVPVHVSQPQQHVISATPVSTVSQPQVVQDPRISIHHMPPQPNVVVQSSQGLPVNQGQQTVVVPSTSAAAQVPVVQVPTMGLPASVAVPQPTVSLVTPASSHVATSIPDTTVPVTVQAVVPMEAYSIPSQLPHNHIDASSSTSVQHSQPPAENAPETVASKPTSEEAESAPSGGSNVAIDNKIEQAMDLVKSHLMFAVREEVDVLKEKIAELMERISLLEYENGYLRANATQETLSQLTQSQQLHQQQQQQQQTQNVALAQTQLQQNIQSQQSTL